MKLKRNLFMIISISVFLLIQSILLSADEDSILKNIRLPEGFKISIYAHVPDARSLALGPDGVVFVGNREGHKVYALINSKDYQKVERVLMAADNLFMPNGVAYKDRDLFVSSDSRILRYKDIMNNLNGNAKPDVIYDKLPSETWHGWRYMGFGPDGLLYVSVGAPCNICRPDKPVFGTICRMDKEGNNFEIFASGIRNSVGFDWDPAAKELYFTDNGRDYMGDNLPPDELDFAPEAGLNFGFPYIHGKSIKDPEFGNKIIDFSKFTSPVLELEAHVAALGMRFYTGGMFPEEYKNRIFIAEHGSWNRSVPIGYRIVLVKIKRGETVSQEVFADGWLRPDGRVLGRPVDVLVMPDGALLVSDDKAGLVYRISCQK